jgi:hypothetical protein
VRPAFTGKLRELVPLARVPDLAQIERLRPLIDGRAVCIVGSAPMPIRHYLPADEVLIPVNGGISSTTGIVPIWIVGSKLQDAPNCPHRTPLHWTMLEQAKGRTVGHVCLLRGPKAATEEATLGAFEKLQTRYRSWSVLDKPTKRSLEGELCARVKDNAPCSSGILAAALACYCGATRVRLVGFSFTPGYHYLGKDQRPQAWWRNHVEADTRALKALVKHGYPIEGEILRKVAA